MNRLSKESSPYLLQHAHNPVDWHPWGEEALTLARTENKPILVSIGYSACHWCHVMEKESFENPHIAEIMNRFLVCIKVDREERPDIDAIYMDAVQAMGVRGGWPLNVFLMPNAQPFYGLTYLPPQNWAQLLMSIEKAYTTNFEDLKKSAEGFTATLQASETAKYGLTQASKILSIDELDSAFEALQRNFDQEKGGMDRAPKFPMPSIYTFLLRYYDLSQNPEALRQVELSLNRIALGGIYDHVGGGWARYSVDDEWFIPHFEKMLYDNAQLLSVYAQAFKLTKQPLYRQRITQTIQWLQDEMAAPDGGFYSALDADSEGIEGKFYIWTKAELEAILGEDYHWFAHLYSISEAGNWEHGFNHLHLTYFPAALLELHQPPISMEQYEAALQKLAVARQSKVRPGTDDKVLASWNGLLLKGLADAYQATGDENTRQLAIRTGVFLKQHMFVGGQLLHSYKNGKATIAGFLEDYAAVAEALTALYQITFDIQWLQFAQQLLDYTIAHFYNAEEQLFFFTDDTSEALIARKMELFDNVIPASNSIMAHALYITGTLLSRPDYIELAVQMASKTYKLVMADSQWVTNWAALHCLISTPTAEVVIAGDNQDSIRKDFQRFFVPNAIVMAPHEDLPLTIGKATSDTTLYVCYDKTCQMPVRSVQAALQQIEEIY